MPWRPVSYHVLTKQKFKNVGREKGRFRLVLTLQICFEVKTLLEAVSLHSSQVRYTAFLPVN